MRSKGQSYAVDFSRDQSEVETAENYGRQLRRDNEIPQQTSGGHQTEDLENIYTTEMEEGEEHDLKARKSIIRSELKDGSLIEENQ